MSISNPIILALGICPFDRIMEDFEKNSGVLYQTVAGTQPIERTFVWLRRAHKIIQKYEGENDGLVPLSSAIWKDAYLIKK